MLDQIEEYFLYHGRDRAARLPASCGRARRGRTCACTSCSASATTRSRELDAFKARMPGLFGNVLRLDHLDREAGARGDRRPARASTPSSAAPIASTAEPELVEAVLDEVATGRIEQGVGGPRDRAGRERRTGVEAPFLQLVLERLWEEERASGSDVLRHETLERLGGAERIVEEHLERALAGLSRAERDAAARMFDHLVTPSGTKIAHGVARPRPVRGASPVGRPSSSSSRSSGSCARSAAPTVPSRATRSSTTCSRRGARVARPARGGS